jgi:hypothetical protein
MTSTEARQDIHTAAHADFDPADYKFIGVLDTDTSPFRADDNKARQAVRAMETEGFPYVLVHPHGQCDSCGQHLRYVAVMFHHPSAALVEVGVNCLVGRFAMAKVEVKRMMAEAKKAREAHALLDTFLAQCDERQELAYATYAWNIEAAAPEGANIWGLGIMADIARKARLYGTATEGQLRLVRRILGELEGKFADQERRNAEFEAARAAERGTRVDAYIGTVGEKKRPFTGVVRIAREFETQFGMSTLYIIDTPEGTAKWFTSSRTVELEEGQEVSFTATVKAHEIYDGERQTVVLRPKFA